MRYRLGPALGQGGMAEVFDAELVGADGFRRRVAFKRIRPEFAGEERFKAMFMDEARIASRLHHASIVGIVDYGLVDGLPYQVLELVEGVDLRRLARLAHERERPIAVEVGVHVCREVAYALDYAHRATGDDGTPLGVVHRDVSPSNILCSWGGDVKLTDFGIAIAHERRSEQTEIGVAKGKRSYMAPEALMGERVDGRADLFALGCVLHWLCTGQSPIAEPAAMADLIRRGKLALDGDIPEAVRPVIDRATRAERSERYRDGREMGDALAEVFHQLSERGGRAALRQLLDELRPPRTDVTPTFDREVGPDPTASGHDATRTLVTRVSVAAPTALASPGEPTTSGRRSWPLLAALVVVAVVAGAWVGADLVDPPPRAPDSAVAPAQTDRSEVRPAPVARVTDAGPAETSEGDAAPSTPPEPRTSDELPRPRRARRRARQPVEPPVTSPAGASRGTLMVAGANALNLAIRVDGRVLATAPFALQLPMGRHRVELVSAEGRVMHRRVVELTTSQPTVRWAP